LKAAEQLPKPGSDSSTATGSSTRSRCSLGRTPLSSKAKCFTPTPLSSKAAPFQSSQRKRSSHPRAENKNDQGVVVGWMPVFTFAATLSSTSYSEEAQEDVYASQEGDDLRPYSETLQEDVYIHGAALVNCEPQRGRTQTEEADSMSLRTLSPPAASTFIATAAASLWSLATNTMASVARSEEEESRTFLMPVKRTFIHYDTSTSDADWLSSDDDGQFKRLTKSASAPSIMIHDTPIDRQAMVDLHARGECSPCAYFYHKRDGCRWGEDCKFCHTCPPDEIKKRKKLKMKAVKEKRLLGLQAASSPNICELSQLHDGEHSVDWFP